MTLPSCHLHAVHRWAGVAWLVLVLTGCGFPQLAREVAELKTHSVLAGSLVNTEAGKVIVNVYSEDGSQLEWVDQQVLADSTAFFFVLPKHAYLLVAFDDANADGLFEPSEWLGSLRINNAAFSSPARLRQLTIDGRIPQQIPAALASLPPGPGEPSMAYNKPELGTVVSLDEPLFSKTNGVRGLWEPMSFVKEVRGGLFFMEPYSASKTPVLLVHGAGGSPQDFRYLIDHLDRERYQPWVFYYPSALPLKQSAYGLTRALRQLQAQHHFERLVVVAHSMGGLVVTRFMQTDWPAGQSPYALLFVSLSTPWGGVPFAQFGLDHAPAIAPSWVDVAPASAFLADLKRRPLPTGVDYHLLYTCRCGGGLLTRGFDGVVDVDSELDQWAREQAQGVYGFDVGHLAGLSHPPAVQRILSILDDWQGGNQNRGKHEEAGHDGVSLPVRQGR